jgi:hypothetical protein
MDAMQKRRMWKVAIAHLALTIFAIWKLIHSLAISCPPEQEILLAPWGNFWSKLLLVLQPMQFLVVSKTKFFNSEDSMFLTMVALAPFWSICFSWIFVKLDNWLNHFPVLGKKVF